MLGIGSCLAILFFEISLFLVVVTVLGISSYSEYTMPAS